MITTIGIVLIIIGIIIVIGSWDERIGIVSGVFLILGCIGFIAGIVLGFFPIAKGNYSQGERTGVLNKISHKGFVCKTHEGYILVGGVDENGLPEKFEFTIKKPEILQKINEKQGQKVTLIYQQYLYSTPCWGETDYEIIDVK